MQPWHILFQLIKNSITLSSYNSETMIIWYLRSQSYDKKFFFSWRKKLNVCYRQVSGTYTKNPPRVTVHKPVWYLLKPCILIHQIIQLWRCYKSQKRPLITHHQMKNISKSILWLVVQPKYWRNNKELPIRI
jgi:hypothetical protein